MTVSLFTSFVANKRILIADPSVGSRTSIAKVLKDLGAKASQISLVASYESACQALELEKPQIIVCEYNFGNQCGLNLIQKQKEFVPNPDQRLTVLVTGNALESTIAEAAEEDVDCYLLKPLTVQTLREHLMEAVGGKVRPTAYRKLLDAGKNLLTERSYKEAAETFLKAAQTSQRPAMAHYYHGQACIGTQDLETAEKSFRSGLSINEYHYRCLTGLFDLYVLKNDIPAAYQVGRKVTQTFPCSPKRLDGVLKLAIRNETYDDIEHYYQIYINLDYRTPELTKCLTAALVVAGKHHLAQQEIVTATSLFKKALIISQRSPLIFKEIIGGFIRHDCYAEAEEMLTEFPPEQRGEAAYLTLEFHVAVGTATSSKVIELGRKLIAREIYEPEVYDVMIREALKHGSTRMAESLAYDAGSRWRDQQAHFMAYIQPAQAPGQMDQTK